MTLEQRAALEEEWKQAAQQFDKWGSVAAGASAVAILLAAQLSGFGIYLGASTLVGALRQRLASPYPSPSIRVCRVSLPSLSALSAGSV